MRDQPSSAPVEWIPTDEPGAPPEPGMALCLSGGGYRAMLFHLGTLWRLNELGYLSRLSRVSSVSGGSITAGMLGLAWPRLAFDEAGVGREFLPEVAEPILRLARVTVDLRAVSRGLLGRGTVSDQVASAYRKHLFGHSTLQDLPADPGPRFVINAANVQSTALWRFSRPYAWDYRVGQIPSPAIELATAVAASSAFPPFLSPCVLRFHESDYTPESGTYLQRPPYTTTVVLTDGGVYDNLGLETAWKRYATVLVSDAGGRSGPEERARRDWLRHARRVINLSGGQAASLRKRQLIASYEAGQREGAYWGIHTDIRKYRLSDALPCPLDATMRLASTPTRLARLPSARRERLVNWGYAVCDAAMRAHVDRALPAPTGFPYPNVGVG